MNCYELLKDIIIPLLSAVIGGLLTLGGVYITIKNQNKKDNDSKKLSVKPWIFSLDDFSNYDTDSINQIFITGKKNAEFGGNLYLIIKNTDNAVGIIERFETEDNTYYSDANALLEKDSVNNVVIELQKNDSQRNMFLFVKDTLGNEYRYEVSQSAAVHKMPSIKEVDIS